MSKYIATFFTHYDAVLFRRRLELAGIPCRLMPAPRRLSSSCGTCAAFFADVDALWFDGLEIERLALEEESGYRILLDNR